MNKGICLKKKRLLQKSHHRVHRGKNENTEKMNYYLNSIRYSVRSFF